MLKLSLLFLILATAYSNSVPAYDEFLASKMINVSAATYYTQPKGASNRCPRCYPEFKVIDIVQSLSLLSLIGYDQSINSLVIAFRGSDNNMNWLQDMIAFPSFFEKQGCYFCTVHLGFRKAYAHLSSKGLKKQIKAAVKAYPDAKIIFTGHSLGGALANLASINFVKQYPQKAGRVLLYTLGQPRVGDERFAKYHSQLVPNNFRIIHAKDIVPHQPPYIEHVPLYRHSGIQVWYQQGMVNNKICVAESDDCSNSIGSKPKDYDFSDHSSNQYLKLTLPQTLTEL